MEYGKIIAVTGLPGLFELLSSKNDGAIARSLEDKSTRFIPSRVHNFSHLESIEVFTVKDNVNLAEIFLAMEKEGSKPPDGKDIAALKKYFEKVYPDLDFERVYTSDLKKMAKWFEVLKANQIEIKLTPPEEEPVEKTEEPAPVSEEKPKAQKTAPAEEKPLKTASKKTEIKTPPKAAEKPVKVVKQEKAAAGKEEKPAKKSPESKATKSATEGSGRKAASTTKAKAASKTTEKASAPKKKTAKKKGK